MIIFNLAKTDLGLEDIISEFVLLFLRKEDCIQKNNAYEEKNSKPLKVCRI